MALSAGDRLGPFEILSSLGVGGMGEVYRARDPKLDRDIAIKVLPDDLANNSDWLERFRREARTLGALDHPGIVTIYSVEDEGDTASSREERSRGTTSTTRRPWSS